MRKFGVIMSVMLTVLAFASTGLAQPDQTKVIRQSDRTVYKKKTVIDFSGVTLQGELTKPEGSYLLSRKQTRFRSLLRARADFVPEMKASTETLF